MVGRRGGRRTGRRAARRTTRRMNRRQGMMESAFEPEPYYEEPAYAPPPPSAEAEADPYEKLKEAKKLLDDGILTEEEFAAEKKRILGS